jgi:Domain of unknown function (DUF1788)
MDTPQLTERLFQLFTRQDFIEMKGVAHEIPFYIQTYEVSKEDEVMNMVSSLGMRLKSAGIAVCSINLFEVVLADLKKNGLLDELIASEADYSKQDLFETLQNVSDPKTRLVPRIVEEISRDSTKLTFITGSGRVYPFLRTHTILESLQPAMVNHPVVIFFPGEYTQDDLGGSHLRLFGSVPSPKINNPFYRAVNLDHVKL